MGSIADSDGSNPMSGKLNVVVTDCGADKVCSTVADNTNKYTGTLAAMSAVIGLSSWAANEEHKYEFSVALDSTAAAYAMGVVIALVLGGSQALARSLFSSMVPQHRQASFFGFYELAERGTAWVGTLVFAVVFEITGSYRGAFSSLLVLFVTGGLLLAVTDTDAAERASQTASAAGRKRSA